MPKFLSIFGLVIAGLMFLIFGLDLATGIPFGKVSLAADIGFVISSLLLGFVSWLAYRDQV